MKTPRRQPADTHVVGRTAGPDVDILRVADGGPIDTRSPGGDHIAAGDGVGNTGFPRAAGAFCTGTQRRKTAHGIDPAGRP